MLTALREQSEVMQDVKLVDPNKNLEMGRVTLGLKFTPHTFEQRIEEDKRKMAKFYFDVFVDDPTEVKERAAVIEKMCVEQQREFEKTLGRLDFVRSAHKGVLFDIETLKASKEGLERENDQLRTSLDSLGNIKEIHVHIDMLLQSDHGVDVLREKYAKLFGKLLFERSIYNELSERYFQIEEKVQQKKALEQEKKQLAQASAEQDFHIKRYEDQFSQLKKLKEAVSSQERTIESLNETIKSEESKKERADFKEVEMELKSAKAEHLFLVEKHKQLSLMLDMNDGRLTLEQFNKIKNEPFLADDSSILEKYKAKANKLLSEVERLQDELDSVNIRLHVDNSKETLNQKNAEWVTQKNMLKYQTETLNLRAENMRQQSIEQSQEAARIIAELKEKIAIAGGMLPRIKREQSGIKKDIKRAAFS